MGDLRGGEAGSGFLWEAALGDVDFFLVAGEMSLEGDETLPERSSDVTDLLALWELSDRSLRFSFFSLCFSVSQPLSLASLGFSSVLSLFLCLTLCFFPTTGRSSGTGGGGLGVRGPFFLLWPPLADLPVSDAGEDTEDFLSFFPEPGVFTPALCLGDPLDFRDEGDPLELDRSGEGLEVLPVLGLAGGSSFLITISSRLSMFSCSNFMSSR